MFRSFPHEKHCFQCPDFVSRCRLYLHYTAGNFNKYPSMQALAKTECEREQASIYLIFASNSSKGKILRALSNWMGPFYTPISGFPRVSGLQLQTRLLRPLRPPCFFFLICRVGALRWQPITSVEVKFDARQVEASVVVRVTKLKLVAESRTRVYFSQHVVSTCNIVFCCETSWPRRW